MPSTVRSRLSHIVLHIPPPHPSIYFPPITNTRMQREISAAWHELYNKCFAPHNCVQNPHETRKKIGDGVLDRRPKGEFVLKEPLVVREKRGGEDRRVRYARDMIETMSWELEACQGEKKRGNERGGYCFRVVRCDGVVGDTLPRLCESCLTPKAECANMREDLDLIWKLFDIVQDSERKWIANVQRMKVKAHTKTEELATQKKELENEKAKCKEYEQTNAGLMHYNTALEEELRILRDVIKALKPHWLGGGVGVEGALEENGDVNLGSDLKTEDEDEGVEISVLSPSTVWYEWWRGVKDLLWQCFGGGSFKILVIGLLVGVFGVALCFMAGARTWSV
jgi:hypothetical protein